MLQSFQKINKLLNRRQKLQMAGLVVMMLIGAVLEALGITLIIPILQAIVDPDFINSEGIISGLYHSLGMESVRQFAVTMMIAMVVVFALKNIYLYLEQVVLLRFIYTNQFATSNRMMINFMKRPYEYYLGANTSIIQRNITSDINNVYALILNILQLISEVLVFGILVAILLAQDAKMILTIAALLILILILIKTFIKPVMLKAGKDNQDFYAGLFKWISESVDAVKEIKIANKENYFITEYSKCGNGYVNAVQKYTLFSSTPRLLIEWICVAGLVLYMVAEILRGGGDLSALLPQIGVFGLAAARLLPSANRINTYLTNISYFQPFLNNVSDNLQEEIHDKDISYRLEDYSPSETTEKLPVTKEIRLQGITYRYPNSETYIFRNADALFPVGKSIGIVGASGGGKTTLIDVMLGLLHPEQGEILADGTDVRSNYPGWLKNIGYIPQSIYMLDTTIRRNVAFGVPDEEIDDEKVWRALREAQLEEHVRSLPEGLDTEIGQHGIRFSGGQRQRIGIARALFEDPEVLVLDEATSALDNETEKAIMESVNRLHGRKTLIIIAHRLQTIEKCDMIYRVQDGSVIRER